MPDSLVLNQGLDSGFSWELDASVDGYSARCYVRDSDSPTGTLLTELTAVAEGTHVSVSWTAEDSLEWVGWRMGYSDVILYNPGGRPVQVIWEGRVVVNPVVTHV